MQLSMSGKGNAGKHNGIPGDLLILIEEEPDKELIRDENDLIYNLLLSFPTAALGGTVEIPTIDGKVKVKIEPGTQPGKVLRLRTKGLPNVNGYGTGDLLVNVSIYVPETLSKMRKRRWKACKTRTTSGRTAPSKTRYSGSSKASSTENGKPHKARTHTHEACGLFSCTFRQSLPSQSATLRLDDVFAERHQRQRRQLEMLQPERYADNGDTQQCPEHQVDSAIQMPPSRIQSTFISTYRHPPERSPVRTSLPKGHKASPASFSVCIPKGIPTMVTISNRLATTYSTA